MLTSFYICTLFSNHMKSEREELMKIQPETIEIHQWKSTIRQTYVRFICPDVFDCLSVCLTLSLRIEFVDGYIIWYLGLPVWVVCCTFFHRSRCFMDRSFAVVLLIFSFVSLQCVVWYWDTADVKIKTLEKIIYSLYCFTMNPTTTKKKRKADANAMRQPFLGSMNHGPPPLA